MSDDHTASVPTVIRAEHERQRRRLARIERCHASDRWEECRHRFRDFRTEALAHLDLESRLSFTALGAADPRAAAAVDEVRRRQATVREMIEELDATDPRSLGWMPLLTRLRDEMERCVRIEEEHLLPELERRLTGDAAAALGDEWRGARDDALRLEEARARLDAAVRTGSRPAPPRSRDPRRSPPHPRHRVS